MQIKKELSSVEVNRQSARAAEVAAMIRFAGQYNLVANSLIVEVELDLRESATRLRDAISELFGIDAAVLELGATSSRKAAKYLLRITSEAGSTVFF